MRFLTTSLLVAPVVSGLSIAQRVAAAPRDAPVVVGAKYDGSCYYPAADPKFDLHAYLGTWYQVAGTPFFATIGSKCIQAEYSLNTDGTVKVNNTSTRLGMPSNIVGSASLADASYGPGGALKVTFPGIPNFGCPGPNYIVQEYGTDYAIVQAAKWDTLYILSRTRQPCADDLDAWIQRAVALGTNATKIEKNDQTGCE